MIYEKKIKSGPLLEANFYPAFSDGRRLPTRSKQRKRSTAEQERYNHAQAVRRAVHDINANFDSGDILMHPTYEERFAPCSEEKAYRDISNYLRRIKALRERTLARVERELAELPDVPTLGSMRTRLKAQRAKLRQPFKYYYALETVVYKTGRKAGLVNYHFHLFITGGLEPSEYERAWPTGLRCNANRFQPEKFGPEAAARYITKEAAGKRRIRHSRNLIKPTIKSSPAGISPATVERIAKQRIDDAAYWERKYRGYKFVRCYPRYNSYNGYWYVSVIMYKSTADPPPWNDGTPWPEFE